VYKLHGRAAQLVSRYVVYLSHGKDIRPNVTADADSQLELLAVVPANESLQATVPMGTFARPWALVFLGSDDGIQEELPPAALFLRDLRVHGRMRELLGQAVCEAQGGVNCSQQR
jgi:hypothetical protein